VEIDSNRRELIQSRAVSPGPIRVLGYLASAPSTVPFHRAVTDLAHLNDFARLKSFACTFCRWHNNIVPTPPSRLSCIQQKPCHFESSALDPIASKSRCSKPKSTNL
jgi:hypothetical protein